VEVGHSAATGRQLRKEVHFVQLNAFPLTLSGLRPCLACIPLLIPLPFTLNRLRRSDIRLDGRLRYKRVTVCNKQVK